MKILPIAVLVMMSSPAVIHGADDESAIGTVASYAGHVTKDAAGAVANDIQDLGHAAYVPSKKAASSVWGFLSDVGNGMEKFKAVSTGDGVAVNASVYSLALRQAERDNNGLTMLQKERDERKYNLDRAKKETERLSQLAKDYKEDSVKFESNISSTLVSIAESAKKLEGWDKAHQEKLNKFVSEHKKLGALTAEDGAARVGGHTLVAMNEAWVDLESFIKKSPDSAKATGLDVKLKTMSSLLAGGNERITDKEKQIMLVTAKINELSKVNEQKVADDEASMKRQMILGTLNNSVNNLITSAEFSKVRSQLAFSHFKDIEKELGAKGVKAGDVKEQYKKNANVLAEQYNNTPFGIYVNGQIAKAMGSVCDLVSNQCKDGTNSALFDFLDDSSRSKYKSVVPSEGNKADATTIVK